MLFLLFHLGEDPYVLEAACISEMLPLVRIKPIPGTTRDGLGIINLRGTAVPIIDLSERLLGRPAQRQLSTRIALIRRKEGNEGPQWLGLVLEQATEILRLEPASFASPGFTNEVAPYLGPVLASERGLIHWIEPDKLFSHLARAGAVPKLAESP